jgi:site-specific recombinase XerD
MARFIGLRSPEHVCWCGQIRAIPLKRAPSAGITYLEKSEMDALLAGPNLATDQGRRDYSLLLFLYNTGARADEAAHVLLADLKIAVIDSREHSLVEIHGKGNKLRRCPLWPQTVSVLKPLVAGRQPQEHVFLNRCHLPTTRFGIHTLVERYARKAAQQMTSLMGKRISPHTIRHTSATHLLRAGVDINTIRAWLGHTSLNTTNIYAEVDFEMKAKALATCEVVEANPTIPWREDPELMRFLHQL